MSNQAMNSAPVNQSPRRFGLWKWLLLGGALCALLLATIVSVVLYPYWQEWRLITYIRAHGGDVLYERRSVRGPLGESERNVVDGITLPADSVRRIDFARLAKLKHVTYVYLSGSHVEVQHLEALAVFPELTWVNVDESFLYGDCCAALAGLPKLDTVTLGACGFEDETTLHSLARCRLLRSVGLVRVKCTDRGAVGLAKVPTLATIDLNGSTVGDETVQAVAALPLLEELDLYKTHVTDTGVASLAQCRSLKSLSLSDTAVTGSSLARLAALPSLISLNLDRTKLTREGALQLGELPHLETLSLAELSLDDSVTPALVKLTALVSLDLNGSAITDSAAAELAKLPALKYLRLEGSKVTQPGIEKLRAEHPDKQIFSPDFTSGAYPSPYLAPATSP